jgi:hypothetical protein
MMGRGRAWPGVATMIYGIRVCSRPTPGEPGGLPHGRAPAGKGRSVERVGKMRHASVNLNGAAETLILAGRGPHAGRRMRA